MAAARHILIMCGDAEIDGHAFCLGIEYLNTVVNDCACPVTYLMREAIFRSRHTSTKQEILSSDIYSLGELVDMYHSREAKILHDKIYALLGMSSDVPSAAGLEPNYSISWKILMQNLVQFLLGDQTSVETSEDSEIAFIRCKGRVLGRVSSVTTNQDTKRDIEITVQPKRVKPLHLTLLDLEKSSYSWKLPSSTKPIKEGDIICFIDGAQTPTVIRLCEGYCAIIMITTPYSEERKTEQSDVLSARDFALIWDWERSSENSRDTGKYDTFIHKSLSTELECQYDKITRMWNLAQILGDSRQHERAEEKEQEVSQIFERELEREHLHSMESKYSPAVLSLAARNGHAKFMTLILAKYSALVDYKNWEDRTPLSLAAENGHESMVKLLLETGKVDVDHEDNRDGTPLSWAAGNGHEAVVKLLLETGKVEVDSKTPYFRTPLWWAAKSGHEAIVKLLLETSQIKIDFEDNWALKMLRQAADRGHMAVVKLLLEMGKGKVDPILYEPGWQLWLEPKYNLY
jgi:hypothetical protein